jgi:pyrroline-5-carboxylate reductase
MAISCNQGVIGFFANDQDKIEIKQLLSVLGTVIEMEKEEDLDSLTLLSGCGPAIVSQFMEFLANYGIKIGLSADICRTLALQTFKGTTAILEKSELLPSQLIQSVSTKGGISEAILLTMKKQNLEADFTKAMNAGYAKLAKLKESLQ